MADETVAEPTDAYRTSTWLAGLWFKHYRIKGRSWLFKASIWQVMFARYNAHCMYYAWHLEWAEGLVGSDPPQVLWCLPRVRVMRMSPELRRQCGDD